MPKRYSKLLGLMKERNITQRELAAEMEINNSTLNYKLKGKGEFSAAEIDKICKSLDIDINEIGLYFFS